MRTATQTAKQYTNPILSGFYPDPSICRVGGDYYLVNSTFAYFPGIPVFHSNDLVNWKLIGHVMSRTEQMDLTGMGVSRAIFAPTIRYHNGLLYVTCTIVDGKENFVVTAKDPAGPWSNPVWLPEIIGIDPSPFFDEDGKAYIVYNSIPPDDKPLYDGHRTIRINSFDSKNLKIISDNRILVNGGTDISQKPSWIEGPHLIKKYGYYYLVAAEGGTYENHSVVVFRSKTLDGPFVP
jgi:alpha-N-arabinofuranosidase